MKRQSKRFGATSLALSLTCLCTGGLKAAEDYTKELYTLYCQSCHSVDATGAPQAFVPDDWEPRLEKGMDQTLENVIVGIGNMPPLGMCMECTEQDLQALIHYMSNDQQTGNPTIRKIGK